MDLLSDGAPCPLPADSQRHTAKRMQQNSCSQLSQQGHDRLQDTASSSPRNRSPSRELHNTFQDKLADGYENYETDVVPPRLRILELMRPDDPGREELEAIVRPGRIYVSAVVDCVPHGDAEETWNFLRHPPHSPAPSDGSDSPGSQRRRIFDAESEEEREEAPTLADELLAAEFGTRAPSPRVRARVSCVEERARSSLERERLARMALAVEEDEAAECGLAAAARQLDLMLAESRDLHDELAEIHDDMQAETRRATWCAAAARALLADTRALRFLDDVLALLRGDVAAALRARAWPFALGVARDHRHNYIV